MAVNIINTSQSPLIEDVSIKKTSGSREEELFAGLFSSLLQQINNYISDNQEKEGSSSNQQLKSILQSAAIPSLLRDSLTSFFRGMELPAEKNSSPISINMENDFPTEVLGNVPSLMDIGNIPSIEGIQKNIIEDIDELIQKNMELSAQPEINSEGIDIIKSFLEKHSAAEHASMEGGIETKSDTMRANDIQLTEAVNNIEALPSNIKIGGKTSNSSNESMEKHQMESTIPEEKLSAANTDTASIFKVPESGRDNLNIQESYPGEVSEGSPKPSELSQVNIDNIAKSFKTLRLPDSTELRVKLTPEELGEVTVKVILEKGHITGHITAESRDAAVMLQSKLDILKHEIALRNVNLTDISVSVFTGHEEGAGRHSSREFQNKHGQRSQGIHGYIEETNTTDGDGQDNGLNIIA